MDDRKWRAEQLGRDFIGIELNPECGKLARERRSGRDRADGGG
jgi:hypothetical protein